jgi:hypothetical protein
MPVVYGSPDLLPSLSVVYVCGCGLRIGEYGAHAAEPPPGWVRIAESEYVCEHCAAYFASEAQARPRQSAPA